MPWGKWWLQIETPEPGGTTRGRPREEVEWMRRVSDITLWRLQMNHQHGIRNHSTTGRAGVEALTRANPSPYRTPAQQIPPESPHPTPSVTSPSPPPSSNTNTAAHSWY